MAKTFQVDTGGTLTTNLISYYKLEDATDFYSTNNLTETGSPTYGAGKVNNCLIGSTSIKLRLANDFGINGGTVSIAGWINPNSQPGTNVGYGACGINDSGTFTKYGILYQDAGGTKQLRFTRRREGVAEGDLITNQTLNTGTWYHVVLTYNSGTTTLEGFLNGSSTGTANLSGNGSNNTNDSWEINRVFDGAGDAKFGDFKLDEFGVWNKVLSTTEISDLYNSGSGQTMVDSAVGGTTNPGWLGGGWF